MEDDQVDFFSISEEKFVFTIECPELHCAAYSSLEPILYLTRYSNEQQMVIQRIDCINFTVEEIYRAKPPFEEGRLHRFKLFENNGHCYLKFVHILGLGQIDDVAVEIIDLQKRKLIFWQQYLRDIANLDTQHNRLKKSVEYYYETWLNLEYNSGTPYYSTISTSH